MKPIEADLSGVSTLGKLFELWLKEHKKSGPNEREQAENIRESTFPDLNCTKDKNGVRQVKCCADKFYESFCYDGFLTDRQEGKKTILFICREANIADEKHICNHMLLPETTRSGNCFGQFWMKEQFLCLEKRKSNKYCELIEKIIGEFPEPANLAYMNLNKRGGFGTCNMARVGHYVKLYHAYIKKEIELIQPDLMICGGTYDTVIKYFSDFQDKCKNYYHPCYRIEEKVSKASV